MAEVDSSLLEGHWNFIRTSAQNPFIISDAPLSALLLVLLISTLQAQIVEVGTITGVVTDNTGALVPNAQVTVQNTGTGLTSHSTTDSQGIFVSPPLHPGDYNVVVEATGFSKVVEHTRLEVGQRVSANVVLAVGTNAETIEVQASGELLETETSSVSNLRTEQAVKSLSLNGRNFAELIGLGAGVVPQRHGRLTAKRSFALCAGQLQSK